MADQILLEYYDNYSKTLNNEQEKQIINEAISIMSNGFEPNLIKKLREKLPNISRKMINKVIREANDNKDVDIVPFEIANTIID